MYDLNALADVGSEQNGLVELQNKRAIGGDRSDDDFELWRIGLEVGDFFGDDFNLGFGSQIEVVG